MKALVDRKVGPETVKLAEEMMELQFAYSSDVVNLLRVYKQKGINRNEIPNSTLANTNDPLNGMRPIANPMLSNNLGMINNPQMPQNRPPSHPPMNKITRDEAPNTFSNFIQNTNKTNQPQLTTMFTLNTNQNPLKLPMSLRDQMNNIQNTTNRTPINSNLAKNMVEIDQKEEICNIIDDDTPPRMNKEFNQNITIDSNSIPDLSNNLTANYPDMNEI